ncbi:type II secretion system protein N [Acidiferrobacter sp.]|uniref:type II secretion system protein N n=1 Tax=Acidiferrobacter sp. TaxID=1872107 RepID=UPI002630D379|nr:type II secretion system protein N [Acidiferrobacter sp.]
MQTAHWQQSVISGLNAIRPVAARVWPLCARLVNAVAVAGLAGLLARGTWETLEGAGESARPVLVHVPPARPSLGPLLKSPLFGRLSDKTPTRMSRSGLALSVEGLVAGQSALALIAAPGAAARPYPVGATIAPGVVLVAVTSHQAIVRLRRRLEGLALYPRTSYGSAVADRLAQAGALPSRRPRAVTVRVGTKVVSAFLRLPRATVRSWLAPAPAGGLQVGHMPGRVCAGLRLRPGDIIEAVNGRAVHSRRAAVSAYRAAANRGSVVVEIRRGVRERTIRYVLQAR